MEHLSRRVGLVIVLASMLLIVISKQWYSSRIFSPLEKPISLVPNHVTTDEFKINLRGRYHINVFFRDNPPNRADCNVFTALSQKWTLTRDGRVEANSSDTSFGARNNGVVWGPYFGSFSVGPGRYKLNVDLLTGTTCADGEDPQLAIWTSDDNARSLVQATFWSCLFTGLIGAVLVFRSFTRRIRPIERTLSVTGTDSFNVSTLPHERRPRPIRIFAKDPHLGLIMSCIFLVILLGAWVVQVQIYSFIRPRGVWVYLPRITPKIDLPAADDFPVLRLERSDKGVALFVNSSRAMSSGEVREALNSALETRRKRFVYLSADPSLDYSDAAQGIDIIHSVKAEVILYTPKMGGPEFEPTMPQSSRPPKPVK